jgi:ABC-2 type transport system permease protein
MAYRANFFLEIFGMMALFGAILFLWISVYENSATGVIGGYTLAEMLTYIIGGALISTFAMSTMQGDEIDQEITEGFISNYLLKPLNTTFYWLARDMSRKMLIIFFSIIAFSGLFFVARNFLLSPASLEMFVVSLIFIIMGWLFHFLIFYVASVVSFWLGRTWSFRFTVRVLMEFATGSIVPISFVPGIWGSILNFLPFKFLVYLPLQIYLGKLSMPQITSEFLQFMVWLILLAIISWYLWRRGIKSYTASGA